jgi:branched-chain amino acid transport system ATP-binding protein
MRILSVEAFEARHGLLQAVRGVGFHVDAGETLALVGANGAGKTTLLRGIAGAHRASAGRVVFDGADITALPAHARVPLGIALVPEGRKLFGAMTTEDNLRVAERRGRPGPWTVERVLDVFPLLRPKLKALAADLSGGQQQAVAIGRALMTNPRLLLLDEVSLGLSPVAVEQLYASLRGLMRDGTTVVLVEQDLTRALAVADRVVCMLEGRAVFAARAADTTREEVLAAYFGLGAAAAAT